MARFYAARTGENSAQLLPDEAHHAYKVLRLEEGDEITLILEEALFAARLLENGAAEILSQLPSPEPSVKITLYQGIPKAEKMDWIVQKCTEAGVCDIVPVAMQRCISKLTAQDAQKKTERWQRIAAEAAKQAGRAVTPTVHPPVSFARLCEKITTHELALVPWEEAKGMSIRKGLNKQTDIAIVIGPEGGIAAEEIERLNAVPVTLGPRIFRTETAGLAALISIMQLTGNME